MSELEEKLASILNNPQMMQQIQSMANAIGQETTQQQSQNQAEMPSVDLSMLSGLSGILGKSSVNQEEQALLKALTPYLSRQRVSKLERAMRAARMAKLASAFLGSGGMQLLSGR